MSWSLHYKLNRDSDSRAKVNGKSRRSPSPTQRTTGGQGTLRGDKQSSMTNPEWSALKTCIRLMLHRLRIYVYTLVCMYQPLTEKEVLNSKESKQEYIEGFEGRKRGKGCSHNLKNKIIFWRWIRRVVWASNITKTGNGLWATRSSGRRGGSESYACVQAIPRSCFGCTMMTLKNSLHAYCLHNFLYTAFHWIIFKLVSMSIKEMGKWQDYDLILIGSNKTHLEGWGNGSVAKALGTKHGGLSSDQQCSRKKGRHGDTHKPALPRWRQVELRAHRSH